MLRLGVRQGAQSRPFFCSALRGWVEPNLVGAGHTHTWDALGPKSSGCGWSGLGGEICRLCTSRFTCHSLVCYSSCCHQESVLEGSHTRVFVPQCLTKVWVYPQTAGVQGRWGSRLALQASGLTSLCWRHPNSVSAQSPRAVCTWVLGDHPGLPSSSCSVSGWGWRCGCSCWWRGGEAEVWWELCLRQAVGVRSAPGPLHRALPL